MAGVHDQDRCIEDMRSVTRGLLPVAVAIVVQIGTAQAHAEPQQLPCLPGDPSCVVVVVSNPGDPGGQGHQSGGTGSSKPDPCANYPGGLYTQCTASAGQMCLNLYDRWVGKLSLTDLNAMLAQNQCPVVPPGAVPPSPATLAQRAADGFVPPSPSGHRSPSETQRYRGLPMTWVNLWTYFWTDASMWKPLTATARAGGVWATVTARPVSLIFDPGDGSPPVQCADSGRPWVEADGDAAPSDGACGYRYTRVTTAPITATQSITWQLTWVGSGNTSGRLSQRTTSTSGELNVMQIQTVVTR
jgi:hypothetical protein